MKRIIYLLAILFIWMKAKGQNQNLIDSLKKDLHWSKEDTNTVRNSMFIADEYVWSLPDTALSYANRSLALADKLNYTFGQIYNLGTLAYIYSMRRNDSLALSTAFRSVHLSEKSSSEFKTYSFGDIVMTSLQKGMAVN